MYTYRIRGKRGPFKIILPASFGSFLTLPGMSGSPPSFFRLPIFFIRSWTGMFMRISIGNLIITGGIRLMKEYCQVLFIFFFAEDYAETGVVLS